MEFPLLGLPSSSSSSTFPHGRFNLSGVEFVFVVDGLAQQASPGVLRGARDISRRRCASQETVSARLLFPSSRPPRHPRLVLGASISAGLDPSSSSMALRSRRRPASFALFVTFIVDDALRKIYLRPGIYSSSRLPFPSSSSSLHPRRRHALGIGAAPSSSCKEKNILFVYREG